MLNLRSLAWVESGRTEGYCFSFKLFSSIWLITYITLLNIKILMDFFFFKISFNVQKTGAALPWLSLLQMMPSRSLLPGLVLVGPHFCQAGWPAQDTMPKQAAWLRGREKDSPQHILSALVISSSLVSHTAEISSTKNQIPRLMQQHGSHLQEEL